MHPDQTPNLDSYQELISSYFHSLERSRDNGIKGPLRSVASRLIGTVQKVRLSSAMRSAAQDIQRSAERATELQSVEEVRTLSRLLRKASQLASGASLGASKLHDEELAKASQELDHAVDKLSTRLIRSSKHAADQLGTQLDTLLFAVETLERDGVGASGRRKFERSLRSAEQLRRWITVACGDSNLKADFYPHLHRLNELIERLEQLR